MNSADLIDKIYQVIDFASDSDIAITAIADLLKAYHEKNDPEDIYTIISWWQHLPNDFNDINTLIEKRRKLSAYSVFMAKHIADIHKKYGKAYPKRKVKQAKELIKKMESIDHITLGKADAHAIVEVEEELIDDYSLKAQIDGYKAIKKSIQDTLTAMHQEIADLREIRKDAEKSNQH